MIVRSEARVVAMRVDGGPQLGYGHAIRCATLCAALRRHGLEVAVVTRGLPDRVGLLLADVGVRVDVVESAASAVNAICEYPRLSGVVIDGYHLGEDAVEMHRRGLPLVMIDDNRELPVGLARLVVNQNLHAGPALYADIDERIERLLGAKFTMVRSDVASLATDRRAESRCVLVSLGGADPSRLTVPLVERLLSIDGVEVVVAIPPTHPDRDRIDELRTSESRIQLDGGDLLDGLARAESAIIGGGTTMYEAAFLGIPAVAVMLADNQRAGAAAAEREGFIVATEPSVDAAIASWTTIAGDEDRRAAMSAAGRATIDGRGAVRVADAIVALAAD